MRSSVVVSVVGLSLLGAGCAHRSPPSPDLVASLPKPPPQPAPLPRPPAPPPVARPPGLASTPGEAIYFTLDDALIQTSAGPVLQEVARHMIAHPQVHLRIEGNCDERGTTEYNIALGENRARAARDYLVRLGIPAARIEIVSFGSERPRRVGHDEGAWAQNRRDDFKIR
jgi:peptidoglycan-associated lipoprotein